MGDYSACMLGTACRHPNIRKPILKGATVMKKKLSILILLISVTFSLAGCGLVTAVPIGQESKYTGSQQFDANAAADDTWGSIVKEITAKAQDLKTLKNTGMTTGTDYAVSFSGKVNEYNTDTPKGYLDVTVDGVDDPVHVFVGKVISGTTVRDCQTVKAYQDFTNQTEWSKYGKTINDNVLANVIAPNNISADIVGKNVEVVGCFNADGSGTIGITPVSLTVK